MSRKDFEAIASIIAGDFASANAEGKLSIFRLTLSLADRFLRINPRFDRARFYAACGFPEDFASIVSHHG